MKTIKWCGMLMILALTACSGKGFTIEGQIDGVSDGMVVLAYMGDKGAESRRVRLEQGNTLKYEGKSNDYTLITIWDTQGQIIAQMVAKDGDRLTLRSNGPELPTIQVKGNEATEQWMKWRKEHHDIYNAQDAPAIDSCIERQIREHPDQLLSTILLVADYGQLNDASKVSAFLQTIHASVRPQRLVSTLEHVTRRQADKPHLLNELTLFRLGKGIDELAVQGKPGVIMFWSMQDDNRQICQDTLQNLSERYGNQLLVADVLVDADSAQWSRTVGADATLRTHWWAPGGMMDPMLNSIQLTRTPTILVVDSTAHVIHTSTSPADIPAAIRL